MKKALSLFFMLFVTSLCFNQTENPGTKSSTEKIKKVNTSNKGIVSYEAAGVEGFKKEETKAVPTQKELTDYSLEELELALSQVDAKLLHIEKEPADSEQKKRYFAQREKVLLLIQDKANSKKN